MKAQMLKIAGVKSEKEFYKKFPDEASFMKAHGKEFKKAMRENKVDKAQAGTRTLPTGAELSQQLMTDYPLAQAPDISGMMKSVEVPKGALTPKTGAKMKGMGAASYVEPLMDVIQGASMIKGQRQAVRKARQNKELTGVQAQAAESVPVQPINRQYIRPEDVVYQPEQMFPSYGVGTNVLAEDGAVISQIGGNPTEIQNTFAPNTIYSDMGYEPLSDSDKVKQFKAGGGLNSGDFGQFMSGGGGDILQTIGGAITGEPDAGSKIGGGIGQAAGMAIAGPVGGMIGKFAGSLIGDAVDTSEQKIKSYNEQSAKNMGRIAAQQAGVQFQDMFGLRNGGEVSDYQWVSHTWQPQVITHFGEHKVSDLLRPPKDADMLRAGGEIRNIRKNFISEDEKLLTSMALGGQLETTWGGYAEPISQNPYMPSTGQTIMFRGQSHDESDGKGRTGIGVKYGAPDSYTDYAEYGTKANADVEVERNEPAVELPNGDGENSMVVYGNLKIPNQFLSEIGDPKAKGKKFKTYVKDLAKKEQRQNKIIDKSSEKLDNLDPNSPFDMLKFNSLAANIKGANMKLKQYADFKTNAAAVQNAINDTAEEMGLNADSLAKGKVMQAKKGANVPQAQTGRQNRARIAREKQAEFLQSILPQGVSNVDLIDFARQIEENQDIPMLPSMQVVSEQPASSARTTNDGGYKSPYGLTAWPGNTTGLGKKTASSFTTKEWDEIAKELGFTGRGNKQFQEFLLNNPKSKPLIEKRHMDLYGRAPFVDEKLGYGWAAEGMRNITGRTATPPDLGRAYEGFPELKPVVPRLTGPAPNILKTVTPPVKKDNSALINSLLGQAMQYLRPTDIEQLDPNQLIGEMFALSQNQVEPVWAQKLQPRLATPIDISLQDIVNENRATLRRQQQMVGYNPAAQSAFAAQEYGANQRVLGEQFRLNQAEKQRVYEQNRNLLNQYDLTNLGILDKQYERQATALSKTKATTQAALNSMASKIAQNKLDNRTLQVYENLYNYRYDPNFRAQSYQLAQFNIPTVGSTSTSSSKTAKSGKKVEERNSSIVKALKNI